MCLCPKYAISVTNDESKRRCCRYGLVLVGINGPGVLDYCNPYHLKVHTRNRNYFHGSFDQRTWLPHCIRLPFESVDVTFSRGETHGLRGLTSQDGANSFAPFAKEIYEGGRRARSIQRQNICSWSWFSNRDLDLIQLLSYCIQYMSGGHVHLWFKKQILGGVD